uniref:Uncharacterized protein n=1 Tax=Arundo donax TaxID=35708 RepID=A0A0A9FAN4_ARUDO
MPMKYVIDPLYNVSIVPCDCFKVDWVKNETLQAIMVLLSRFINLISHKNLYLCTVT